MKYAFLIVWTICELIKDLTLLGGSIYLAIWKHCSGWWVVLAIVLCIAPTYYEVIRKEFGIIKEKESK